MRNSSRRILLTLAKKGAHLNYLRMTTSSLAKDLGLSQQSVSRLLSQLEEDGLIRRKRLGRSTRIRITKQGLATLRETFLEYKQIFERPVTIVIRGRVFSGIGEGSYYTSLRGYTSQFEQQLGYEPYPGTLNVRLLSEDSIRNRILAEKMAPIRMKGFSDDRRTYGGAACVPAVLNGSEQCVLVFSERTHYDSTVVEAVAKTSLRKKLGLKDGDMVELAVTFPSGPFFRGLLGHVKEPH